VSVPAVLGLSHLFGEAQEKATQIDFWAKHGYLLDFEWTLGVVEDKNQFLLSSPASSVELSYLRWKGGAGVPGIELLTHSGPRRPSTCAPHLSVFLRGDSPRDVRDGQENRLVTDPDLRARTTVLARTAKPDATAELLLRLGFSYATLSREEQPLFDVGSANLRCLVLEHPLFPQLGVRVLLAEDPGVESRPSVDHPGLSGLSLLVPKLESISDQIEMTGRQRIDAPDGMREVAFNNEAGILLEFLAIKGTRTR
jgi:hypothetical protein